MESESLLVARESDVDGKQSMREAVKSNGARVVVAVAFACACAVAVARHGVASGAMGTGSTAAALGSARDERFLETTIREYDGDLHVMSWSPAQGFTARTSDGARENVSDRATKVQTVDSNGDRVHAPSRVKGAFELLKATIERYFPDRLTQDSKPFEVLFEVSDSPHSRCANPKFAAKYCDFKRWAPIFSFGSAPKDAEMFPTLIPSTLGVLRKCMIRGLQAKVAVEDEPECNFLSYPERKYRVLESCNTGDEEEQAECRYHGLFSIDAVDHAKDYTWENLIPRAVWRGSDYSFLNEDYPGYKPDALETLRAISECANATQEMMKYVRSPEIGPRLRAVLISKLNPEKVDARFFNWGSHGNERGKLGAALGVDSDVRLDEKDFGRYKYQLDVGGGGGTTWSGVIPKLSMPGVLLHHETQMKDSYFDSLYPWVHYIPVREDLLDLEEQIQWAEENPHQARQISANADEWVRNFRRVTQLLRHNYEKLAKPLAEHVFENKHLIPFERAHADPKVVRARERAIALAELATAQGSSIQSSSTDVTAHPRDAAM